MYPQLYLDEPNQMTTEDRSEGNSLSAKDLYEVAYNLSYLPLVLTKVLPSLLKTTMLYKSGEGREENPYRININE